LFRRFLSKYTVPWINIIRNINFQPGRSGLQQIAVWIILGKKGIDAISIEEAIGVSDNIDTPEEEYIKNEKKKRINDELNRLPEKYRIPLILFHKNGLSYDEIAQVLKEPMSIVKNRLYRARLMLRESLSSEREEGIL